MVEVEGTSGGRLVQPRYPESSRGGCP